MNNRKENLDEKVLTIPNHTITKEKIFLNQTHNKFWDNENECMEYIENNIKNNIIINLFSEDINQKHSKRFFGLDYDTIYQLCIKKQFNLYENFPADKPIKLFNDIDIKENNIPVGKNRNEHLDDIIQQTIDLMNIYLKLYNVVDPQIIILKSSTETKLSAHIIFNDIVFPNIYVMKFFISEIKSDLIKNKIIDPSIYRKGCFRLLWNSKFGIGRNLEYYRSINYEYHTDKQLFLDCLLLNINDIYQYININMPTNIKINPIIKCKQVSLVNIDKNDILYKPISILKKYVDMLNPKRADDFNHWIEIGRSLHGSNPSNECFDIWDHWSKQSDTYCSRDFNAYKWNSFNNNCSESTAFGYLKYYAKKDNPDISAEIDKDKFDSIKFNSEYLLEINERIMDNKSFISKHIINWLNDSTIKSLSIKSSYGTGKTRLIKKIFKEFNPKRVLFISYRQTLTYELHGNFKEFGVQNYLEKSFSADRIICQIESLPKLLPYAQFNGDKIYYPSFDIVIFDEIEGILNHFRSPTIDNKVLIFDIMQYITFNSKKILALDGDFGNRSYDYLKTFGKNIILENLHKKNKRNYKFITNRIVFENNIDDDLKMELKIVIVSLSIRVAMSYYNKYKNHYDVALHCSKSDDTLKKELKDVENYWNHFDIVIYSPSVESGVSFDIDYFDKIYVVLSNDSTSPRGLLQMCSRVRRLKFDDIDVYINNLPYKEKANFFTYDDIKEYICDVYRSYLDPKPFYNKDEQLMEIKYEFDLYAQNLVHNETENSNKCSSRFIAYFIKLLTDKGHSFQSPDNSFSITSYKKENILIDEIIKADDIDYNIFKSLLIKQKSNLATKDDKFAIDKYMIKREWNIKNVDKEFLNKFYGKTYILRNLRRLTGYKQINPYLNIDDVDGKYIIDFDNAHDLQKDHIIKDLIKIMGFKLPVDDTIIKKEKFEKNIKLVMSKSKLFINTNKTEHLFNFNLNKLENIDSIKQFIGFVNTIIKEYGIIIKAIKKNKKNKIANKWKTISEYVYKLLYISDIDKYL